jgi:hypothetical protein
MINRFFHPCITAALLLGPLSGAMDAQVRSHTVSGSVRSATSDDPVPSAIVRVAGTSRGTVCNSEGDYRITLEAGEYLLVASSLGYRPDSARINLQGSRSHDFSLIESEIILPEIVVSGEDPAYAIIRNAIANKQHWIDRLESYQMSAFTRQILRRDTTIASITEAFTTGYWRQGDTLHEVTSQKRQTENIEQTMNFASVGRLLNFYEDEIRFLRHSFIGPIADDAFDHYDFKLLRTRPTGRNEVYEIALIPLSDVVPRFRGTVMIEGGTYALIGVDVEPNEAFLLPFIKEKTLRYRQQFSQFEETYWLPADIRIDGRFRIGVPGISLPDIGFSQTSVITDYLINVPIPDSIFAKPRLSVDSSVAVYDSTLWSGPGVLPMTTEEETAYQTLDSTQTLEVQFRPGGIMATLGGAGDDSFSLLKFLDIEYNRVEGLHLGAALSFERLLNRLDVRGGYAYGFSDKQSKYYAGATVFLDTARQWGIGVDYANRLSMIPEQGYFGKEFNSLTSLFVRNDYRDYYMSEGWEVFVSYEPTRRVRGRVTYIDQNHSDAMVNTDYGFFTGVQEFRENPAIDDGRFRSIMLDLSFGRKPEPLDIVARDGLDMQLEVSAPEIGKSEFDFLRAQVIGTLTVPTFGDRYFSPPGFRIRLSAGAASDDGPRQRVFALESASSGYGPFGVMRGMRVKEFFGREYIALNVEHNFRSLPFLWVDIPFLYKNNIEFIVHGGVARSSVDVSSTFVSSPSPASGWTRFYGSESLNAIEGWYSEIGFGISRIFELVRCDFTWRLSDPKLFHFTLAVANFM